MHGSSMRSERVVQVDAMYQRDIERMGGSTEGTGDEDYKKFLAEVGLGDGGGGGGGGRPGGDSGFSRGPGGGGPSHAGLGFDSGRYFPFELPSNITLDTSNTVLPSDGC